MQVGNGESSTCPPSSLYVNGASNFPAFLIKLLYNLPTIVASRMTFDVMDHHVLLFLVGVVADFNWENGSLIVDNPHAQPVLGKPCKRQGQPSILGGWILNTVDTWNVKSKDSKVLSCGRDESLFYFHGSSLITPRSHQLAGKPSRAQSMLGPLILRYTHAAFQIWSSFPAPATTVLGDSTTESNPSGLESVPRNIQSDRAVLLTSWPWILSRHVLQQPNTLASSQCLGNGRKLADPTTKPWLSASLGLSKIQLATVTGSKALAKHMSESPNGKESPALFFLVFQKSFLLGRKKPSHCLLQLLNWHSHFVYVKVGGLL